MMSKSFHIETYSGKFIDPTAPKPDDICIEDIAWALSRIARFTGHSRSVIPYTVAEHSVLVYDLMTDYLAGKDYPGLNVEREELTFSEKNNVLFHALLHDAHEAYIGDISTPLKRIPALGAVVHEMTVKLDCMIFERFGLTPLTYYQLRALKFLDLYALAIESDILMPSGGKGPFWNLPVLETTSSKRVPSILSSENALNLFMSAFANIS